MADFSLTTLFVVPVGQTELPSSGSTQDLTPGQVGIFDNNYVATATPGNGKYFYIAQGRSNTYLQGSKRSDKIAGCVAGTACKSNVTEWYKVSGCPAPTNQIIDISNFKVKCGEYVTITLRAHSSYIDTLYFNGFTRSITVQAPCCDCDGDPCEFVDTNELINSMIAEFNKKAPGFAGDNISFSNFYTFSNLGGTTLRIEGKALTSYGQPCDVAAFPHEYDRLWFRAFVYEGPATTADFIVADACNIVADVVTVQNSNYPTGLSSEIEQLEKNFYSYQAGYLKHLYRMAGYNANFEGWVNPGTIYDTYYIRFNEYNKSEYVWGDYIAEDATVIIAVESGSAVGTAIEDALVSALGTVTDASGKCKFEA